MAEQYKRRTRTEDEGTTHWKLLNSSHLEICNRRTLTCFSQHQKYVQLLALLLHLCETSCRVYLLIVFVWNHCQWDCKMPFVCSGHYLLFTEGSYNNITDTDLYILIWFMQDLMCIAPFIGRMLSKCWLDSNKVSMTSTASELRN